VKPFRLLFALALIAMIALGESSFMLASAQQGDSAATPLADVATPDGTLPNNPSIQLVKVAGGLADPVNLASANDGSGRLFVVERVGMIRVIDKDNNLLPDPFLDISALVKTDFLEQGLLGLAFHPDYTTNGLFYVYYSDYLTNGDTVLAEFHVSADDPNKADPASERVLMTQDKPYVNHNGGTVHFGPDGYLYWVMGDGGLAGDPYDNAQRYDVLLGKMLRIDVDARDAGAYGIPADNPFADTGVVLPSDQASTKAQDGSYHPAAKREICNWGLRNPWQFSFDMATGDLYIADVGQNAWEEINYLPADQTCGWNFGWDHNEGAHCYPPEATQCDKLGVLPVANLNHSNGDCSITGMGVYRGQESPSLDGIYFNSDFCSGRVYGLAQDSNGTWIYQSLLQTSLSVTGSGQSESGELYLTSCSCQFDRTYNPMENPGGAVWRVVETDKVPQDAEIAPTPIASASPAAEAATHVPTEAAAPGTDAQGQPAIEAVDIAFQPTELTIAAGQDVTVTLTNNGASMHNFSITDHNNPGVENLNISVDLAPGQTQTVTINAPAGDYYFFCSVPGHEAAGMHGTIHVK
jgi:glucose/arabinose dehydrogenase/plastocyanin